MRYRRLSYGQYAFGGGAQDYLSGLEAVAQAIGTRLQLLKGEWWEDTEDGLPLFQQILGVMGAAGRVNGILTARIEGTAGVNSVSNVSSSFDSTTRAYSYTADVDTIYGEITITGVI